MRWPWRRRGRRRRADFRASPQVNVQVQTVDWSQPWGHTWRPPPPLPPEQQQHTTTVRLGFTDGTELDLQAGSDDAAQLLAVANRLMSPPR
jgi:hypothetical protein